MISESLARLKAIDQVRLAGNVDQETRDALGEMGETESLRLQMAMDRLSRFMTTLSNVAKKSAEATAAIVQNLK